MDSNGLLVGDTREFVHIWFVRQSGETLGHAKVTVFCITRYRILVIFCKIIYSPKAPLFDLIGHEDKVHDCDWSNPRYMVSGGADNTVRIFKSKKTKGI